MARDLSDGDYDSHGGKIPLKWTAPEVQPCMQVTLTVIYVHCSHYNYNDAIILCAQAVKYRRYSPASDIWSYGMVLYEIWTLGRKPFENIDTDKVSLA